MGLHQNTGRIKETGCQTYFSYVRQEHLKRIRIDPLKIRSQDTWDQFLRRTFDTLWACDFFVKSVWTPFGRRLYHVLFFINIKTRAVRIAGITRKVDQHWLLEQTGKLEPFFDRGSGKAALVRDNDVRFTRDFDQL